MGKDSYYRMKIADAIEDGIYTVMMPFEFALAAEGIADPLGPVGKGIVYCLVTLATPVMVAVGGLEILMKIGVASLGKGVELLGDKS